MSSDPVDADSPDPAQDLREQIARLEAENSELRERLNRYDAARGLGSRIATLVSRASIRVFLGSRLDEACTHLWDEVLAWRNGAQFRQEMIRDALVALISRFAWRVTWTTVAPVLLSVGLTALTVYLAYRQTVLLDSQNALLKQQNTIIGDQSEAMKQQTRLAELLTNTAVGERAKAARQRVHRLRPFIEILDTLHEALEPSKDLECTRACGETLDTFVGRLKLMKRPTGPWLTLAEATTRTADRVRMFGRAINEDQNAIGDLCLHPRADVDQVWAANNRWGVGFAAQLGNVNSHREALLAKDRPKTKEEAEALAKNYERVVQELSEWFRVVAFRDNAAPGSVTVAAAADAIQDGLRRDRETVDRVRTACRASLAKEEADAGR